MYHVAIIELAGPLNAGEVWAVATGETREEATRAAWSQPHLSRGRRLVAVDATAQTLTLMRAGIFDLASHGF